MKVWIALTMAVAACNSAPSIQVVKDRTGTVRAEVTRVDGKKEGKVKFFARNGSPTTTGNYVRDSRNGIWVTVDSHGDTLSMVQFDRGRKNGLQAYWSPTGQLLRIERFKEGVPDGELYRFFTDGSPRQITWYDRGVPEGPYLEWYKVDRTSVALTMGQFVAGERSGQWTWFYGNGRVNRQGSYADGKAVGLWHYWDASGRPVRTVDEDAR
jgi:antitoxin component YwqK of YwqJK toxin-antitoxin module